MRAIRYICIVVFLFIVISCNKKEYDGRDPYCEFVDGNYTFDIDLRRTAFYKGTDFDFKFYDNSFQEIVSDEAKFVLLKGIGKFYNERNFDQLDVAITYSSLFSLPDINRVKDINMNLLTTLEAERIIYLGSSGYSFDEAKKQAREEIYDQVSSSNYFNTYDFSKDEVYQYLDLDNPLLAALTSNLSNTVSLAVQQETEDRLIVDVWNEYILNFAYTGDLALSTLVPDGSSYNRITERDFGSDKKLLKASVSRFSLPFVGGIPKIRGGRIFYGVDTNTYKNKFDKIDTMKLRISSHKYKNFVCNGYFDLSADIYKDSINYKEGLKINVKQLKSSRKDTTYLFDNNELGNRFSTILWFSEDANYHISLVYGKDSLSYEIENRLEMNEFNQAQ